MKKPRQLTLEEGRGTIAQARHANKICTDGKEIRRPNASGKGANVWEAIP